MAKEVKTISKLDMVIKMLKEQSHRVYLLTGTDSPVKKDFYTEMGLALRPLNLSFSAWHVMDKDFPNRYAVVVIGADSVPNFEVDRVVLAIRRQVERGWVVIIPTVSNEVLEKKLGSELMDFLSHYSVVVDLSVPRKGWLVI